MNDASDKHIGHVFMLSIILNACYIIKDRYMDEWTDRFKDRYIHKQIDR